MLKESEVEALLLGLIVSSLGLTLVFRFVLLAGDVQD